MKRAIRKPQIRTALTTTSQQLKRIIQFIEIDTQDVVKLIYIKLAVFNRPNG